jgi:2-polyprenyl-6-methoxyphenol hydroxylase-like FAD-dependent oxidoreductase
MPHGLFTSGIVAGALTVFTADLADRFGLPFAFLERRRMLRVLYDTLSDSSRVLVDKAVVSVEREDSELMRVTTRDGSVYHGNLVVGADGVHSRVRAEMWRLANSKSPGAFPEREMSCRYCHFEGKVRYKADYGLVF